MCVCVCYSIYYSSNAGCYLIQQKKMSKMSTELNCVWIDFYFLFMPSIRVDNRRMKTRKDEYERGGGRVFGKGRRERGPGPAYV